MVGPFDEPVNTTGYEDEIGELGGQVEFPQSPHSDIDKAVDSAVYSEEFGEEEKKPKKLSAVDRAVDSVVAQQNTAYNITAREAVDTDTSLTRQAEVQSLSNKMNLPPQFVDMHLDRLKKDDKTRRIEDLKNTNPYVASWATDLAKTVLLRDEVLSIQELDEAANLVREPTVSEDVFNALQQGSAQLGVSIAGLPALVYNAVVYPQNWIAREFNIPGVRAYTPNWLENNPVKVYYEEAAKMVAPEATKQDAIAQLGEGEIKEGSYNIFLQAVSNIPLLLSMMIGGAATASRNITLAGMGGLEGSSSLQEASKRGKDPAAAFEAAVMKGAAEGILEKYTLGMWSKVFRQSGKDLVEKFGKETAKKYIARQSVQLVKNMGVEGSSEAATSFAQDLADYMTGDKDAMEGSTGRMLNAGLVGSVMPMGLQPISMVMEQSAKAKFMEEQKDAMERMEKIVSTLKAKDIAPELVEDLLQDITKEKKIYVDPEVLQTYFQKKSQKKEGEEAAELTEEEAAEAFNKLITDLGIAEQIEEALVMGKDLEIDQAKWVVKYGNSELSEDLRDDIKFDVEGFSSKEVEQIKINVGKTIKTMQREVDAKVREEEILPGQILQMREELMRPTAEGGKGYSAEDADFSLKIFVAGGKTLSMKQGETAEEWLNRINPRVAVEGRNISLEDKEAYYQKDLEKRSVDKMNQDSLGFYSKLEQEVKGINFKQMPAKNLLAQIRKVEGLKKEEIEWTGLEEFLAAKEGKVSKDEVIKFLQANGVKVSQVVLGGGGEGRGGTIGDWTDEEFIPLSEVGENVYRDAVENEVDHYLTEDDWFLQEEKPRLEEEYKEEMKPHLEEGEDFDLEDMENVVSASLTELARDRAEDYVNTEDYYDAVYRTTMEFEEADGYTTEFRIDAYHEMGRYEAYINDDYISAVGANSLEETKIQLIGYAREQGFIEGDFEGVLADREDVSFSVLKREKYMPPDLINMSLDSLPYEVRGKYTTDFTVYHEDLGESLFKNERFKAKNLDELKKKTLDLLEDKKLIRSSKSKEGVLEIDKPKGPTKWEEYTISGGENYREILITLPRIKGTFTEDAHFPGQRNFVAHVRLKDRTNEAGEKILYIEELQSDWHQQGRKDGYALPEEERRGVLEQIEEKKKDILALEKKTGKQRNAIESQLRKEQDKAEKDFNAADEKVFKTNKAFTATSAALYKEVRKSTEVPSVPVDQARIDSLDAANSKAQKASEDAKDNYRDKQKAKREIYTRNTVRNIREQVGLTALDTKVEELQERLKAGIPQAPFKKTEAWVMLAFKRMLGLAVNQGYDRISWSPGEVHAKRWNTFNFVDNIIYSKNAKGDYDLSIAVPNKETRIDITKKESELPSYFRGGGAKAITEGEGEDLGGGKRKLTKEHVSTKMDDESLSKTYDKILPREVKKYLSKVDKKAKIEVDEVLTGDIDTGGVLPSLSVKLTDKLRAKVAGGQPLFQQDDTIKASVTFTSEETLIQLFNAADRSSFLHETGHIFLKEMQRIVASGKADDRLVKDLNILKNFAEGEFNVEGVEKIIRGFEKYLMEGKAPSVDLQSAFSRFKQWLGAIYTALKKGGKLPKINDEVRGVFDRLLATESEIKEVEKFYQQKQSISELIDLPKETKADLEEKKKKATRTAEEKLLSKYMKAYVKSLGGKKELQNIATAEIDNSPAYLAIAAGKKAGISEENIQELGGQEALKYIRENHKGLIKKDGKVSIEELALETDYESPEALLSDILSVESRKDAIATLTDKYLKDKETEILEGLKDKVQREGEEEYHNEDRLSFLIAEYEVLERKIKPDEKKRQRKLQRQAYKDVARDHLLNKPTKSATRYDLYTKAEQKYSNLAYEEAKKGNLDKALAAKNKQILNHIMVSEAVKLRDQKKKIERSYKTKNISAKLKKVENDYVQIVASLISGFSLNENIVPTEEVPAVEDLNDEFLTAQTPEWLFTKEANWKDLTFREFLELDETIKTFMHVGRDTFFSMKDLKYKTITQAVEASVSSMSKIKDAKKYDSHSPSGKAYKWVNGMYSKTIMMEYIAEEADGYKVYKEGEFGPVRTILGARPREAEGDQHQLFTDTVALLTPAFTTLAGAKDRFKAKFGKNYFELPGLPVPKILQADNQRTWTAEGMVAFLLNVGNAHNLQVLQNSYGLEMSQVQSMGKFFTTKELQALQEIWDGINVLYDPLDAAHFRLYNRHLTKVDAQEIAFVSAEGDTVTLKGGYYPLAFDNSLSDLVDRQSEDNIMKERNKAVLRTTKPRDGMSKIRGVAHSLPPRLELSVLSRHIADTTRFITHAEYLRDAYKFINNAAWREVFRAKFGKPLYEDLKEGVEYMARPEKILDKTDRTVGRILGAQRTMATTMILGLNMGVSIKQRLSMLSAQTDIGEKWIFKSLRETDLSLKLFGLSSNDMWQELLSKSKYLKAREGFMDREIRDVVGTLDPFIKRIKIPFIDKKLSIKDARDATFFLIQHNDRATVAVVWKAAYMKSLEENKNTLDFEKAEKKAIAFADAIVAQTQPSALPLDLNALQRSRGAIRLFTLFMTWTFKQGNRFGHKYRAWQSGAISTKEYSAHVIREGLISPWTSTIITSLLISGELPEWWEYMTSPVEYGISWIPIVRDIPGSIKYRRGIGEIPGAFLGIEKGTKVGVTGWKWLAGEKEYHEFLWSIAHLTEAVVGVPALKAVKNLKNTHLILTGQKEKK